MDVIKNKSCLTGIFVGRKPLHRHWLVACSLAVCALAAGSYSSIALAQTVVPTTVTTGHDDLRGGNSAFISMRLMDGTVFSEQLLSTGLSGGSVTTPPVTVTFPGTAAPAQIRSITIRHDGNPRNGHPFDTYDNWDLKRLWFTNAIAVPVPPGTARMIRAPATSSIDLPENRALLPSSSRPHLVRLTS